MVQRRKTILLWHIVNNVDKGTRETDIQEIRANIKIKHI